MKKLLQIQSELKAPKNQTNAFGKYRFRSQEDILEAVKPLLVKYNCLLRISDQVIELAGIPIIMAAAFIVDLDTQEAISVTSQAGVDIQKKGMDIAQSFGASSSYARKYALNGLFLIDDTKDSDHTNKHGKETPESDDNKEIKESLALISDKEDLEIYYKQLVKGKSMNKSIQELFKAKAETL